MVQGDPDLGEQALSKLVELGLNSQLDEVEKLDVDIRTNPIKLVQGEVDAVAIAGEGIVMQQDLRVEALEVATGKVSVNPLSTMLGKVELTEPANAEARIVLTEDDINRALNSDYLREKMQNQEVETSGKKLTIDTLKAHVHLPGENQIMLDAEISIQETGEVKQVSIKACPTLRDNGHRIALEDVVFAQHSELSITVANALFAKVMELLDLRNFEMQGMSLQMKDLKVRQGQMIMQASAQIEQFPSS